MCLKTCPRLIKKIINILCGFKNYFLIYQSYLLEKKQKENFWPLGSLGCLHLGQHESNENVKLWNIRLND